MPTLMHPTPDPAITAGGAVPAATVVPPPPGPAHVTIRTRSGHVRGLVGDGIHVFKGIPYAQPPFGPNRLRPPRPVAPWSAVMRTKPTNPVENVSMRLIRNRNLAAADCCALSSHSGGCIRSILEIRAGQHG